MTKTNIRKRAISILLILMVMLTMTPMTASATEPEWTTVNSYAELQTAVKAKKEYIKLGRDIDTKDFHYSGGGLDIADWLTFDSQTCTLDLNGKTLSLMTKIGSMPTFMRVYYGSNLTIKDSQGGGQITGEFENTGAGDRYLIHVNNSSLTLEGGTFRATAKPYKTNINVIGYSGSNVTIKDGVTISQPKYIEFGGALEGHGYALCDNNYGSEASHVVIDGGTFDGWVRLIGYQDTNDSVQINSGTFKKGVQLLYKKGENNSAPAVTVNGGTFEDNVYLNSWAWKMSLNMPYRLNGGTFYGSLDLCAEGAIDEYDKPKESLNVTLGLDKCFGYSAIAKHDGVFTGRNIHNAIDWETYDLKYTTKYDMLLKGTASNPVRIIPNAWGMKSVTLDGNPIDYFKDWKGTVERMDNSTAHTIKFEWYPLASELVNAGYSYNARCDRYISGNNTPTTDTISATDTEYSFTIPAGADPKVYSFDLHLNLKKSDSPYNIGVYSNEHIVKLVVSEAPVVEPDPTIEGSVYYTSGIVFGRSISTAVGNLPAGFDNSKLRYQWQRRTDSSSDWTNIDGATSGSYTPVAADMGENVRIRVVVTAEGYLGEIVGAAVKVSKAANNNYPEVIQLEAVKNGAGNYTGFKITNFDSDCEYVYSTTDTPNWSANQITSATVTGLTSDTTYYVFARFKETATHTAGSIVSSNSIRLFDYVPLDRVLLEGYGSHGTIYIKKGESVTLKVNADPSNANSWKEITFKDEGATTSNIAISNGNIAASTGTATPFPNGHSITITGVSTGSANLRASYPSATSSAYGTWNVVVYDDSTVANALRLESVYAYEDITLSENDTAELPTTNLPKLLPENSGYHLEWRIIKTYSTGFEHLMKDDNITLENGKIEPIKAHDGSASTRLELVAVKEGETKVKPLSKTSSFNVTVTKAPPVTLTGITVAPTKVNLDIDGSYPLSAVKVPVNATGSLTWTSDKPEVAEVDNTGKVTAKAQGTAIITVSCGDKKATCTVTVDHQHDYTGQPYLYLDPGNHYQECKANDGGLNIEVHDFSAWTKVDDTNHSRTCSKCKKSGEATNYTETAAHTWVWVVDQAAALNQPGKQHEECTGCHAKRSENTVIPALQDYAVVVTGGKASDATGTITRAMEGVEVTVTAQAPIGKHFVKWVVKAGGVTLANETSATTTFTMPANDVTIEAIFEKNASSGGYVPTVQKPEITIIGSGKADLSADGRTATITADAGHELVSVVLNGKEMGKVEKLTGLKTGDKATITFQAKTDGKAEMDKMIAQKAAKLTLMARSAKTAKKNIKVVVKGDLKAITDAGYTVKYKFYRSTKKSAGYKAMLTKKAPTYFNTYGKKGTMYYYKARVMIYDKEGNFVAQTALKQCKYANRLWTK